MNEEFDDDLDFDEDFQVQDNYNYDEVSSFDNLLDDYNYLDNTEEEPEKFITRNDFYDNDNYNYDYSYDDEDDSEINDKNNFRKKLVKLFIAIIVILIVCFLTYVLFFNNNDKKSTKEKEVKVVTKQKDIEYDQIFLKVKVAALKYYDEKRLEQSSTDVSLNTLKTLQLIETIDKRIDLNNSTVKINKNNEKYSLTIILKGNSQPKIKNYLLGHYDYCDNTYLCDIKQENNNNDNNNNEEKIEQRGSNDSDKYLYEYVKKEKRISNWSSWSNPSEVSCDTDEITCTSNDCLKETKITSSNVRIDSSTKTYIAKRLAFKTNGKVIASVCRNYDYVKINNKYYRTENNSNYKDVGLLKKDTQSSYNNWIYKGRINVKTPPNDTINTRYVYIDADYSQCGATCSNGPSYYYDKYVFSKNIYLVTDLRSGCNDYIQKGIPDYSISEQKISVSRVEDNYKKVCYKKERTRTINNINKISKWSVYNDQDLLNDNYVYSGNKKEK